MQTKLHQALCDWLGQDYDCTEAQLLAAFQLRVNEHETMKTHYNRFVSERMLIAALKYVDCYKPNEP